MPQMSPIMWVCFPLVMVLILLVKVVTLDEDNYVVGGVAEVVLHLESLILKW